MLMRALQAHSGKNLDFFDAFSQKGGTMLCFLEPMYTRLRYEVLQSRMPANPVCRALHTPGAACGDGALPYVARASSYLTSPNSTQREAEYRL